MRILFASLVALAAVGGGLLVYVKYLAGDTPGNFRTATVKRDSLRPTISATGTVEPEEVVDVGAQVGGMIKLFGDDPKSPSKRIDYGSIVEEGTVLAEIDATLYKAQVDQAAAALNRARADLEQMKAKLLQAKNDWERAKNLINDKAIPQTDYDAAVANYEVAKANVGVDEAAIKQAEASLQMAKTNLDYTIIKAPVKGVIVDRRVNIGQTVVAAMNAPSLFLLAKDLSRMQVWAQVNEADMERIYLGMPVRFTVDKCDGRIFHGKVIQIRLNAQITQNVVTYPVVVETENPDLKLLPYLTANLQFELEEHKDALLVPNAALRWEPRTQWISPDVRAAMKSRLSKRSGKESGKKKDEGQKPGKTPDAKKTDKPARAQEEIGQLWVKDGKYVRPVDVKVGPSDGTLTVFNVGENSEIKDGVEVVIGEVPVEQDAAEATNPFAPPKFMKGGGGKK